MEDPGTRSTRSSVRVIRLPRAVGAVLAIPILLAIGAASLAALLVGGAALFLTPRFRRHGHGAQDPDGATITLGPEAYRRTDETRALLDDERR